VVALSGVSFYIQPGAAAPRGLRQPGAVAAGDGGSRGGRQPLRVGGPARYSHRQICLERPLRHLSDGPLMGLRSSIKRGF